MEEVILDLLDGWKRNVVKISQGDILGQESIETLEDGIYMPESHIV